VTRMDTWRSEEVKRRVAVREKIGDRVNGRFWSVCVENVDAGLKSLKFTVSVQYVSRMSCMCVEMLRCCVTSAVVKKSIRRSVNLIEVLTPEYIFAGTFSILIMHSST